MCLKAEYVGEGEVDQRGWSGMEVELLLNVL